MKYFRPAFSISQVPFIFKEEVEMRLNMSPETTKEVRKALTYLFNNYTVPAVASQMPKELLKGSVLKQYVREEIKEVDPAIEVLKAALLENLIKRG